MEAFAFRIGEQGSGGQAAVGAAPKPAGVSALYGATQKPIEKRGAAAMGPALRLTPGAGCEHTKS